MARLPVDATSVELSARHECLVVAQFNHPANVGMGPPVRHIRELGNGVDRQALMSRDGIQYFATVSPSHSIWTTDGLHAW